MNVLTFDIETIPDVEGGRRLHDLAGLSDQETAEALFAMRRQEAGTDMLKLHLQQVVAISAVFRTGNKLKVWSIGDETSSEAELIERFFQGIERYTPTLVSWNGNGFDLPVLNYRALRHGIAAPSYWEMGASHSSFKWNNYISRYHFRHTDVMDILALYQPRAYVPLDQMATLLGFPGKMGMSGSKVWETYLAGDLKSIRDYCETDVLNTYLVYLRFQMMRGQLTSDGYAEEIALLKRYLADQSVAENSQPNHETEAVAMSEGTDEQTPEASSHPGREHLGLFLSRWESSGEV